MRTLPPRVRVGILFDAVRMELPAFTTGNAAELAGVGETHLALEVLCDNLHEGDVALSSALYNELVGVCREFDVDDEYFQGLRVGAPQGDGEPPWLPRDDEILVLVASETHVLRYAVRGSAGWCRIDGPGGPTSLAANIVVGLPLLTKPYQEVLIDVQSRSAQAELPLEDLVRAGLKGSDHWAQHAFAWIEAAVQQGHTWPALTTAEMEQARLNKALPQRLRHDIGRRLARMRPSRNWPARLGTPRGD